MDGFTEVEFKLSDGDTQVLVDQFWSYISRVTAKAAELTREKYANEFKQLDEKSEEWLEMRAKLRERSGNEKLLSIPNPFE